MQVGYINFTTCMGGNTKNAYDPTTGIFTAPQTGRYSFKILMVINNPKQSGYYYEIAFRVNDKAKYYLFGTSTLFSFSNDSRHFSVEYDLASGDRVGFYNLYHSDNTFDYYSFIEGKLVK